MTPEILAEWTALLEIARETTLLVVEQVIIFDEDSLYNLPA